MGTWLAGGSCIRPGTIIRIIYEGKLMKDSLVFDTPHLFFAVKNTWVTKLKVAMYS